MRKIILNLAVTLDGFIEGPNGETDWCIMDNDMNFDAFLSDIDTIFYGRVSYDVWGNHQPDEKAGAEEKALWEEIHSKKKYVFSTKAGSDENATYISKDIAATVAKIKNQKGKNIWLYGGAGLIKTFISLKLIDTYKMSVHPVALGSGKPLFENLTDRQNFQLTDTRVFKSGVVELTCIPKKKSTSYG